MRSPQLRHSGVSGAVLGRLGQLAADHPGESSGAQFANARSVRNALENARLRHACRLAAEPDRPWTMDDLMRLEPPDIAAG
jgi:hypothetical protein